MSRLKKYIKKSVPKKQLGGLLSNVAGGFTGTLFGQGLPNDAYNYQNTGHRSTSYDGLQYIPQTDEPNIMPQMLDAYNTKFKLKSLYDPEKHKLDTGDFEKNLKAYQIDEDDWRTQKQLANNQIDTYIKAHRYDPEKMSELPMYIQKVKDNLMMGVRGMQNTHSEWVKGVEEVNKAGQGNKQYFFGANNGAWYKTVEVPDKTTKEMKQVKMVLPESEILKDDNATLAGWQPASINDIHNSNEYFKRKSGFGYDDKVRINLSTPEKALKDMQELMFSDAKFKQTAQAVGKAFQHSNIGGFDADTQVWKEYSSKSTNKNNLENIEASAKQMLDVMPEGIKDGLLLAFNRKENVIVKKEDKNGKVTLHKVKNSDLTRKQREEAFNYFVGDNVRTRLDINKLQEQTADEQERVNFTKVEHRAGSNAKEEEEKLKTNNILSMFRNRNIQPAEKSFGAEYSQDALDMYGNESVWSVLFKAESTQPNGDNLRNNRLFRGAIVDNTLRAFGGGKLIYETKEGEKNSVKTLEQDALMSPFQTMARTTVYSDKDGNRISEREALKLKGMNMTVKKEEIIATEIAGIDYRKTSSSLNNKLPSLNVSRSPSGKIVEPNSPKYKAIAGEELKRLKKSNIGEVELKKIQDEFNAGRVIVTTALVEGQSTNDFTADQTGGTNNDTKNTYNDDTKSINPQGKFGGKLQQGGIIPEEYFNKIELPNLNLDDLY